ncbi:MAG: DUF6526 family protein [Chitinophagaceae bacterium]
METQNYANHRKLMPPQQVIAAISALIALVIGIGNFGRLLTLHIFSLTSVAFILLALSVLLIAFYARSFALKAQDRAILSEEMLRHFMVAGKPLDPRLTRHQIIALRFANDEEWIKLTQKAAEENLSSDDIKKSIRNWKPDLHRI